MGYLYLFLNGTTIFPNYYCLPGCLWILSTACVSAVLFEENLDSHLTHLAYKLCLIQILNRV